jgi:5'-nucleotidase (lipoprotein e(P4) family)
MKRGGAAAAVLFLLAGAACRTTGRVPSPASAPAASPAAPAAGNLALRWVRNSAEYPAATIQAYRVATRRIDEIALSASRAPGTWAVSLDADETLLDNSQYAKERLAAGLGYSSESWREWVSRRAATPIPGSAAFLRHVKEKGGVIVIVTNRTQAECPDTAANFIALALPFDAMLCRPDDGPGDKEPRYDRVENGTARPGLGPLQIMLWVGDNIQDFPHMRQEVRKAGEAAFAQFGQRFIIIPNPTYGSWERNPTE